MNNPAPPAGYRPTMPPVSEQPPGRSVNVPEWLKAWVPIGLALLSLALSVYTLYASSEPPDLRLIIPVQVTLSNAAPSRNFSQVMIQTTFISTGLNNRADVIENMYTDVEKEGSNNTTRFTWREIGSFNWTYNPDPVISYVQTSDPMPLLISPSNGQAPIAVFDSPAGWTWDMGTYDIALTAIRTLSQTPLTARFKVNLAQADIEKWSGDQSATLYSFDIQH